MSESGSRRLRDRGPAHISPSKEGLQKIIMEAMEYSLWQAASGSAPC